MIAQLVVGALLGAVLWTVFSYLWQEQPVVALVLAAVATTGLVFGVRALRRSDDLQTTVLAVVVGLVVTVSPAAIVLLSR
jgi:predicted membrane metal-binding protein